MVFRGDRKQIPGDRSALPPDDVEPGTSRSCFRIARLELQNDPGIHFGPCYSFHCRHFSWPFRARLGMFFAVIPSTLGAGCGLLSIFRPASVIRRKLRATGTGECRPYSNARQSIWAPVSELRHLSAAVNQARAAIEAGGRKQLPARTVNLTDSPQDGKFSRSSRFRSTQ